MPLSLANFSAWVTVEGNERECYAPEYSADGKTATCWIASEAGKHFSIGWGDSTRMMSTAATLTLDGVLTKGGCLPSRTERPNPQYPNTVTKSYFRLTSTTVRPFVFSSIQLTDDESLCLSRINLEKMGCIELVIHRAVLTRDWTGGREHFHSVQDLASGSVVHERAKKASVHRVGLGTETYKRPTACIRAQHHEVLAKFIFRYTSYELLRANGLIPTASPFPTPKEEHEGVRSTTSSRVKQERNLDNVIEILSDNETQHTNRIKTKGIKKERNVKREPQHQADSDVIDLT